MSHSSVNVAVIVKCYVDIRDLYLRALNLGELILQLSEEKIFKLVDERNRILNRIGSLQENVEALVENLEDPNPGIIAQIEEAKNQIRDLSPKFGDQLLKINRFFLPKLKEKRKEVVNTNKRHRAVLAYLKSPSFNSG